MANGRDAEHEQLAVDRADADREPSRCAVEIHRSGGALAVSVQAADDAVFTAVGRNAAPGGPAREVDEGRWNVRRSEELGALRFGESVFGADRSGRRARMGARGERQERDGDDGTHVPSTVRIANLWVADRGTNLVRASSTGKGFSPIALESRGPRKRCERPAQGLRGARVGGRCLFSNL